MTPMAPLPTLQGASDDDPVVEKDDRGRISLGRYARHRRYTVTVQAGGQILLTPVHIVPAGHPVIQQLQQMLDDPSTGTRRTRPRPQQPR